MPAITPSVRSELLFGEPPVTLRVMVSSAASHAVSNAASAGLCRCAALASGCPTTNEAQQHNQIEMILAYLDFLAGASAIH